MEWFILIFRNNENLWWCINELSFKCKFFEILKLTPIRSGCYQVLMSQIKCSYYPFNLRRFSSPQAELKSNNWAIRRSRKIVFGAYYHIKIEYRLSFKRVTTEQFGFEVTYLE